MVGISEKDVSKVESGINSLLEPMGYIIMIDPKNPKRFFIQVTAQDGHEEDVQKVLEWIGSLIASPSQTLKNTFWNGDELVKE